jgi:hypothetical protein
VLPTDPDGRLSVLGVDGRFNGGILGELYFGIAQAKANHALHVGPVIYTMNALGGQGMRDNFLGPKSDTTGSVTSILFQYDYSVVTLARYLSHYPKSYWTDGPDVKISIFGTHSSVKSNDATYDGTKKLKLGGEVMYSPLSFLSVGGRFDRVMPTNKDSDQSFSVISPKIVLRTDFFTHEAVTLQYSRYIYGNTYPKMASCGAAADCSDGISDSAGTAVPGNIDDIYNKKLDPKLTGRPGQYYDKDVIYLAASMWW